MRSRLKLATYLVCALVSGLLTMGGTASAADENFRVIRATTIPGNPLASFDISFVDPALGIYLLADRTNAAVDVLDTTTNDVLVQLKGGFAGATGNNDTSGPNGVLVVSNREIWAGDGNSTIKVIDLFSQQVTHVINTGGQKRADELCWDPRDHLVLMANDAETPFPFVTFISTDTYQVLKTIVYDGTNGTVKATNGIEQCQWDRRTGQFLLNIPEVNGPGNDSVPGAVSFLSPETLSVVKNVTIPLANCAGPQGMAIGPRPQVLLGCNAAGPSGNNPTVIINEHDASVLRTLNNESGADEVWFNPGDRHYLLARSAAVGPTQFLGVVDSRGEQEDLSIPTANKTIAGRNAHSVAADPVFNQVYVPIPAGVSTVCSTAGGSDAQGCVAVFLTPGNDRDDRVARGDDRDDRGCFAAGAPVIAVSDDGEPEHLRGRCR